jgi:hypothetical protein
MPVTNPSSNRIHGISLGLFVGLWLVACHPKPAQLSAQTPDLAAANDTKLVERMEKMRTRAQNAPGGTVEASDFASHVTMLFTQGVAKRHPVAPAIIDEAVACLDQAKEAHPDDAADLLVRKGELLIAAGKSEPGAEALRDSIAARPTLRAFSPLAKSYAADDKSVELVALCKKTLPAMKSEESRYAVLDECFKQSGATAPEVGLGWAPPKEVMFYKARKRDLDARLAAAKQQKAKDEAKAEQTAKEEAKAERKETSKK